MYRDHTVAVVVPAYNEEVFVGEVIETIPDYVDRIYAVDDRSTDGTWNEIRRAAARINGEIATVSGEGRSVTADGGASLSPRIVPIRHEENRGVGAAIKTGYLRAREDEIDVTAVMAGDGQMDPDILSRFLDPIIEGEADYAKGNRLLNEEFRSGMPRFRLFGNAILTLLTKIASGYWKMMDPQNGYTAISLHALENVDVESMYEYYGYCNDLLVKLNVEEMRIADVAMPAVYGDEKSDIRYLSYIKRVSMMLLQDFLWRLKTRHLVRDFHPLTLFYGTGWLALGLGLASGFQSLYTRTKSKGSGPDRTTRSLLLLAIGWLFVLFAMAFDIRVNEELELRIDE